MYIHSTMVGWKGHPPEVLPDSSHLTSDPRQNYQTLQDMEPKARNTAIAQLSDKQLQAWADAVNSWWLPPLTRDERRDLLKLLAEGLDGQQLHRVASAFGVQDMAQAVSNYGTAQQKLELLTALQSDITAIQRFDPASGTLRYGNEHGHAVVFLIDSLTNAPQTFTQAIQHLQQTDRLGDVLKIAAGENQRIPSKDEKWVAKSYFNAQQLHNILTAVSILPTNKVSTRIAVFKAAMPQLATMQSSVAGQSNAITTQRIADVLGEILTHEQAIEAGLVNMPLRPPGVSIYQNIQRSESQRHPDGWFAGGAQGFLDLQSRKDTHTGWAWLYKQVKNGGTWDYKQLHTDRKPNEQSKYAPFGNFHYGVMANALNVPEQIGLRMAGWAQVRAGTWEPANGNWWDLSGSFGDDPEDQQQIKDGYAYYRSGVWRIWKD